MTDQLSYPRHSARTLRFTLGAPRSFTLAPDGSRVVFLRSRSGTDRSACLWVQDLPSGEPRLVVDPAAVLSGGGEQLTPEERARRERAREGGAGVVAYTTDEAVTTAAFSLSGQLYVVDLLQDSPPRQLEVPSPVADPRLDPTGRTVSFTTDGTLYVVDADGGAARPLAQRDSETVTWGLAEFVAAEEMGRYRGTWWSPDGGRLLVTRVDEAPVQVWHIADPAHPESPALPVRYPAAGTDNAEVTAALLSLDGTRIDVSWDRDTYPYLATAAWPAERGPHLLVQSRDQRDVALLQVDEQSGATTVVRQDHDDAWLELVPGVPAWLPDGRLLRVAPDHDTDTNRLYADDAALTPPGLHVAAVLGVTPAGAVVSATEEPTEDHVLLVAADGTITPLGDRAATVSSAVVGKTTVALGQGGVDQWGRSWHVQPLPSGTTAPEWTAAIASLAETPSVAPAPRFLTLGERQLRAALLLPSGHTPGTRLPVLLDPYGGPHARRVLRSRSSFGESQWWADQGFAVLVVDGRGTSARTPSWERSVLGDLATPALEDQVAGLQAAADVEPDLDLSRVAIRGWSFGGYLAALAVLRRPDVFAAGIAGAPVTDWTLYDTHYTERYLGVDPAGADRAAYDSSSLLDDADRLRRPLMVIHGLADDNVVVAHTLRLSGALLAAGRPHEVLPLTGVTHMTPQEEVAENILLLQLDFLRRSLGLGAA